MTCAKPLTLLLTLALFVASLAFDSRTTCLAEAGEDAVFSSEPGAPPLVWTLMKNKGQNQSSEALIGEAESAINRVGLKVVKKNNGTYPGVEAIWRDARALIALVKHPGANAQWGYVWLVLVAGDNASEIQQKLAYALNKRRLEPLFSIGGRGVSFSPPALGYKIVLRSCTWDKKAISDTSSLVMSNARLTNVVKDASTGSVTGADRNSRSVVIPVRNPACQENGYGWLIVSAGDDSERSLNYLETQLKTVRGQ